jgi:hypothetical protein
MNDEVVPDRCRYEHCMANINCPIEGDVNVAYVISLLMRTKQLRPNDCENE